MLLKRFHDESLAQTSYLLGCASTGEALVVDPNRDASQYILAAEREGLHIAHVTETHIHADFVSGSRELAALTGAQLYLSDEGGADWKYAFANESRAKLLRHKDSFRVGNVLVTVLHTPGHTPEHISFLVTDGAVTEIPIGILTGDFVFVGDVGRPDLLERAAGYAGTMEASARQLHDSLAQFKALPDHVQVWPGHGAGSACGKSLGAIPQSTVGYEKATNWALRTASRDEFTRIVLEGQPDPPKYFAEMKKLNKMGPALLSTIPRPAWLDESRMRDILARRGFIVDTRTPSEFAARYIPGTINIPFGRTFSTWAGSLVPYDTDFYLLLADGRIDRADEVAAELSRIGLDRLAGMFSADVISVWESAGGKTANVQQVRAAEAAEDFTRGKACVLDVRESREWDAGHIEGAVHVSLGGLEAGADHLDRNAPWIVHCQGGARSAIASSILTRQGFTNVRNLVGGLNEWVRSGRPIVREETPWAASH